MKFWQSFSKKSILKQFFFVLFLFAVLIPLAVWDSNTQVKVSFDDTAVYVNSKKYSMTVEYTQIESAELTTLADPGEKVSDGFDDDILRAGMWVNNDWGEYHITADLDCTNCVVMYLKDGRLFVFSSKNNDTTAQHFETLQSHLN